MNRKTMENRLRRFEPDEEPEPLAHKTPEGLWEVIESRTRLFTSEELRQFEAETGRRYWRIPILTELSIEELQALYQRIASRP